MLIQSGLLLLSPALDRDSGMLIWILTPLSFCAFVAALIGIPEPARDQWRQHHGR
jgi:hypothetical protein